MSAKASAMGTAKNSLLPARVSTIHSAIKTEMVTEAISHAASTRSLVRMLEPLSSFTVCVSSFSFIICARARFILTSFDSFKSFRLNAEEQRLAYELQGSALASAARVHGIDARLVFACGKLRGVKDETVHLVFGTTRCLYVQSWRIGGTVSRKFPVNVELHFDVRLRF